MQVAYAVVLDTEVATFCYLFLAHLHINPLGCTLRGNAVTLYDALYAYLTWCCHANDAVERYAPVESALEEYGALKPLLPRGCEIGCHCGMNDIVDGEFMCLACE